MKSAQAVAEKFVQRASNASGDYVKGASETSKDQAQAAIAGKENYRAGITASLARGAYEKGLAKSGKQGWLEGVQKKGANRFGEGVANASGKYATNSAKFDTARNAAASLPRGPKGSPQNLNRVSAVVNALRSTKVGSTS